MKRKETQEVGGVELPAILKAPNRGRKRGAVKNPPDDAPPVEAGPIAEEQAIARQQAAITTRAQAQAAKNAKKPKQSSKGKHKPAPTVEEINASNLAVASANADYCPVMRDAHAYGHDGLASRVVTNLKEYVKLIKADDQSYILFTIQRGGVTLPPLRKVYHKVASIIGVDTLPGKTDYSQDAKASIREYFNKVKKAHTAFLNNVKAEDSAKIALRGTAKVKDGVKSYSFKVTEVTKLSSAKLEAAGASGLLASVQETTEKLAFNVAKSHVFNPVAMVSRPDRARFAVWRGAWQDGDKLPAYCDGHHARSMMDKEAVTVAVAFAKFTDWASAFIKAQEKAKKAKQSGQTNLKDVLGVK
jgi:hypothetical protein